MDAILKGLEVSVLGLLITFLALGVLIFLMIGLQKLFPYKEEEGEGEGEENAAEPVVVVETEDKSEEGAVIAAIAAAVACARAGGREQLGASLSQSRGDWWTARRTETRQGIIRRR